MLKEHNKKVFARMEELLMTNGHCCVVMGTGVGKSYLIKELLEQNKYHALVVSPRQNINHSWEKLCGKKVETVTYQKLANIYKEIDFSYYDIVVCDEVHHIGAPKWGKAIKYLIDNKITMVVGLTESSIRYSDGARDVALEFFHGNVAFGFDVPTAIKNKILNPVTYVGAMYNSDGLKKTLRGKIQSRLYAKLNLVLNKTPTVEEIVKKNMPEGNRKGIIFASTIDDINFAIDFMHNIYPDAKIRVMHSKLPKSVIEKNMNWFKRVKSGYLCSVDMISEGVHIKGVNTLIMLRRTESVNLFNQQLGRCLSASSKEPAILFDLVNNQYSVQITQDKVRIKTNSIKASGKINIVASDQLIIKDYQKNIVDVLEEIKKSLDVSWTDEEVQKLKDFAASGTKGLKKWAKEALPNRSYRAVLSKMDKLGLFDSSTDYWTEEEIQKLKDFFASGKKGLRSWIKKELPNRSEGSVRGKAIKLNLINNHHHFWTDEEIEILKKYYPYGVKEAMKRLNNSVTAPQVTSKAKMLGIRVLFDGELSWTEEERKIFAEKYPKMGVVGIQKNVFPNKTKAQIKNLARFMKISYEGLDYWTEEEDEIIRKMYPTHGYKIKGLNRTKTAIQRRAKILGVKSNGTSFRKAISQINSKKILCVETNKIYANAAEAAKELGLDARTIQACCRGDKKSYRQLHWKYAEF